MFEELVVGEGVGPAVGVEDGVVEPGGVPVSADLPFRIPLYE